MNSWMNQDMKNHRDIYICAYNEKIYHFATTALDILSQNVTWTVVICLWLTSTRIQPPQYQSINKWSHFNKYINYPYNDYIPCTPQPLQYFVFFWVTTVVLYWHQVITKAHLWFKYEQQELGMWMLLVSQELLSRRAMQKSFKWT